MFAVELLPSARAATINVPGDYSTIQAAVLGARNGDVVLVGPGKYEEGVIFGYSREIAVRSVAGPASTEIHLNSASVGIMMDGKSELSGFTITGKWPLYKSEPAVLISGQGTLIKGNIFDGISTSAGFYGVIGGYDASPVIDGNVLRNNGSNVIQFYNYSSPTISNNLFVDNLYHAIDITAPTQTHAIIENNTFVRNQFAIDYGAFSPATIRNNIFSDNLVGLSLEYPYLPPVLENNLFYNNGTNFTGGISDPIGSNGNISLDPKFVSHDDFHLQPSSPAINAGSNGTITNHDLGNTARPAQGKFDIGAYEFVPEPSTFMLAGISFLMILCRSVVRTNYSYWHR